MASHRFVDSPLFEEEDEGLDEVPSRLDDYADGGDADVADEALGTTRKLLDVKYGGGSKTGSRTSSVALTGSPTSTPWRDKAADVGAGDIADDVPASDPPILPIPTSQSPHSLPPSSPPLTTLSPSASSPTAEVHLDDLKYRPPATRKSSGASIPTTTMTPTTTNDDHYKPLADIFNRGQVFTSPSAEVADSSAIADANASAAFGTSFLDDFLAGKSETNPEVASIKEDVVATVQKFADAPFRIDETLDNQPAPNAVIDDVPVGAAPQESSSVEDFDPNTNYLNERNFSLAAPTSLGDFGADNFTGTDFGAFDFNSSVDLLQAPNEAAPSADGFSSFLDSDFQFFTSTFDPAPEAGGAGENNDATMEVAASSTGTTTKATTKTTTKVKPKLISTKSTSKLTPKSTTTTTTSPSTTKRKSPRKTAQPPATEKEDDGASSDADSVFLRSAGLKKLGDAGKRSRNSSGASTRDADSSSSPQKSASEAAWERSQARAKSIIQSLEPNLARKISSVMEIPEDLDDVTVEEEEGAPKLTRQTTVDLMKERTPPTPKMSPKPSTKTPPAPTSTASPKTTSIAPLSASIGGDGGAFLTEAPDITGITLDDSLETTTQDITDTSRPISGDLALVPLENADSSASTESGDSEIQMQQQQHLLQQQQQQNQQQEPFQQQQMFPMQQWTGQMMYPQAMPLTASYAGLPPMGQLVLPGYQFAPQQPPVYAPFGVNPQGQPLYGYLPQPMMMTAPIMQPQAAQQMTFPQQSTMQQSMLTARSNQSDQESLNASLRRQNSKASRKSGLGVLDEQRPQQAQLQHVFSTPSFTNAGALPNYPVVALHPLQQWPQQQQQDEDEMPSSGRQGYPVMKPKGKTDESMKKFVDRMKKGPNPGADGVTKKERNLEPWEVDWVTRNKRQINQPMPMGYGDKMTAKLTMMERLKMRKKTKGGAGRVLSEGDLPSLADGKRGYSDSTIYRRPMEEEEEEEEAKSAGHFRRSRYRFLDSKHIEAASGESFKASHRRLRPIAHSNPQLNNLVGERQPSPPQRRQQQKRRELPPVVGYASNSSRARFADDDDECDEDDDEYDEDDDRNENPQIDESLNRRQTLPPIRKSKDAQVQVDNGDDDDGDDDGDDEGDSGDEETPKFDLGESAAKMALRSRRRNISGRSEEDAKWAVAKVGVSKTKTSPREGEEKKKADGGSGSGNGGSYLQQMEEKKKKRKKYKKYTINDYRALQRDVQLGGLGPDYEGESYRDKADKLQRAQEYGKRVLQENKQKSESLQFRRPFEGAVQRRKNAASTSGGDSRGPSGSGISDSSGAVLRHKTRLISGNGLTDDQKHDQASKRAQMAEYAKQIPKPRAAPPASQPPPAPPDTRSRKGSQESQGSNDGQKKKSNVPSEARATTTTTKTSPKTTTNATMKPEKKDASPFVLETGGINENLLAELQERHEREKRAAESIRQKTQPHMISAVVK